MSQCVLEFTIPVAGDFAVLRELPDDRLIGLGCVGRFWMMMLDKSEGLSRLLASRISTPTM